MKRGWKLLISTSGGGVLFAALCPVFLHVNLFELVAGVAEIPSFCRSRADVIDSLRSPVPIVSWTREGFVTETGLIIPLPGIASLPEHSPILDEIRLRGVEIDPNDQRVYGLLPIFHWCGNDPIGKHIARVDVAFLLEYVDRNASFEGFGCDSATGWGWNVSCFYGYEAWLKTKGRAQ